MNRIIPSDPQKRLNYLLDLSWEIFFARVVSGKIEINKEASMQLHFASVIHNIGEAMCTLPGELFSIELESRVGGRNIDITCSLGGAKAALELKCFRKSSRRAADIDMYDVLKDIERLESYDDFQARRLVCLTDCAYYANGSHKGLVASVTIKNGTIYEAGTIITPAWAGRWKDASRDNPIQIKADVTFKWETDGMWYALSIDI